MNNTMLEVITNQTCTVELTNVLESLFHELQFCFFCEIMNRGVTIFWSCTGHNETH